jgi:hypothetical protein
LLVSLVADGSLKPQLAVHSWRDLAVAGAKLRERRFTGKAVFTINHLNGGNS